MQSEAVVTTELFPEKVFTNEGVDSRVQIRVQPRDGASTYTITTSNQPVIRFLLPNSYYVNFRQIRLKLAAFITGGTTPSFNNGIWSAIQRVRILQGSNVLLDERAYNLFQNVGWYLNSSNGGTAAPWYGVDSQANRRTYASGAGRDYIFRPFAYYCEDKLFPLPLCGDMFIELYPENPSACVESATAITSYTISNPVIMCDGVVPTRAYDDEMRKLIASGMCRYLWSGTNYYISPMTSSTNQIRVPEVSKSVKKVYCIQRLGANMTDMSVNAKLDTWGFNTTTQYQFKINNFMAPAEPVILGANAIEAYFNTILANYDHDSVDKYGELFKDLTTITYATFVSGKFVIGYQFDKAAHADSVLSGLNLSNVSTGLLINVQQTATADNNLETFPVRDILVYVNADRSVTKDE